MQCDVFPNIFVQVFMAICIYQSPPLVQQLFVLFVYCAVGIAHANWLEVENPHCIKKWNTGARVENMEKVY
jgi:hypothetical protein